jgi:glycosyltransferase involved in cell wall biosynthesis
MTLRVAVDATAMPGLRAGAGTYITELVRAVDPSDAKLEVFVKDTDAAELAAIAPSATMRPVRAGGRAMRIAWSHTILPLRVRRLRPDVFFGPHYTLPSGLRCPAVVTFHDPTFFSLPHLHERAKVAYFTRTARSGIARAARVIAPSEFARRGAISHGGADAARVDVVSEGVDLARYTPGSPQTQRAPYVLFLATLEPRKDVPTLIDAFDALDGSVELVLAGQRGWGAEAIDRALGRSRSGRIRVPGYVSEDEKIDLYRGASAFVYPSIAEGFGLPVLEAMACGAPVVTTTGSAPEEIAGDAALLVPPQDPVALRDAMRRVLTDETLASDLSRRGIERAQRYTWTAAAAATVDVWRRAAGDR